MHTRVLGEAIFPPSEYGEGYFCNVLFGFGAAGCYDCLGDGPHCVDIRFHAGSGGPVEEIEETGAASLADLPLCGVDLSEAEWTGTGWDFPDIECGFSGSLCSAGVFGVFGLSGAIRRRRNQKAT